MKKMHHSIRINASREKVWETVIGETTYPQWTSVFNPGSYFKGSWDEGSKILFLGPNPDGNGEGGMVSRIKENRPYEFISIEHLGIISNGIEDTTGEEAKKWAPACENYTFADMDGSTEFSVDMDLLEEHAAMFDELWPKALLKLKELAEK